MAMDMTVELMSATVEVEQPIGDGHRTVGTGFLISDPTPDGRPRVILVTAGHVFDKMAADQATVGYRTQNPDGSWTFAPQKLTIRQGGKPLWTRHPSRDVAAIAVTAPPAFARAAIPLSWLASEDAPARNRLGPGEEMMTLGFPEGFSANAAGFPILRSGRVASYPLGPTEAYPVFLLDFRVYPGNSGGPVWIGADGSGAATPLVAGMLTQQVRQGEEDLSIGIVTQARFIRETVALIDSPLGPQRAAPALSTQAADTAGEP